MEPSASPARPDLVAGIVNALVVLLLPLGFLVFGDLIFDGISNSSTTVRGVGGNRTFTPGAAFWRQGRAA